MHTKLQVKKKSMATGRTPIFMPDEVLPKGIWGYGDRGG
jgi:hypothetical protein